MYNVLKYLLNIMYLLNLIKRKYGLWHYVGSQMAAVALEEPTVYIFRLISVLKAETAYSAESLVYT